MKTTTFIWLVTAVVTVGLTATSHVRAETRLSKAQQTLSEAAAQQKYTFLVFFNDNSAAARSMLQTVQQSLATRADQAVVTAINVRDPSEQAIVERFDVSRAPMPLTIAVAPNGAMTNLATQRISDQQVHESFVTPGMAHCMKAMQDNKLLFVCVQQTQKPVVPPGVQDFCNDSEFRERSAVLVVQKNDPREVAFLSEMEVDPAVKGTTVVLFAPPAVIVGKFPFAATKEQMAAALHEAGKCCDDPNCKHNHGGQKPKAASKGARKANPAARR